MNYMNPDDPSASSSRFSVMLRGGRLRKQGGHVVSYSPQIAEYLGGASRAAMGAALLLGSSLALTPAASAATCTGTPLVCSGPSLGAGADDPLVITNPAAPITTAANFDVSTDEGVAVTITHATGGVSFTDTNGALLEGPDGALVITANGAITVDANSQFVATDGQGITVTQNGNAAVAITLTDGATIESDGTAVSVTQAGQGNATVTSAADIVSGGDGIAIAIDGGWVGGSATIVNTGTVEAGGNAGLLARVAAEVDGGISITNSGDVTNTGSGAGISALREESGEGDIAVTNAGTITTIAGNGIETFSENGEATTIVNSGTIWAAASLDEDGEVVTDDEISGDSNGIYASAVTNGTVQITNSGTILALTNGIHASLNDVDDTPLDASLTITNSGTITAVENNAINAVVDGEGTAAVTITNAAGGKLVSDETGINVDWYDASGTVLVENHGTINSGYDGIGVWVYSGDDVDVTIVNSGTIAVADSDSETVSDAYGIYASQNADGDITVTNSGTVTSLASNGIGVDHRGEGDATVTSSGTVSSANGAGISGYHNGTGDLTITSTNSVTSAGAYGIDAYHGGEGTLSVTAKNVSSTAEEYSGIYAGSDTAAILVATTGVVEGDFAAVEASSYSGAITIANSASGVLRNLSGASDDLAVFARTGAAPLDDEEATAPFVTLNNAGTIIGTIDLGDGDDVVMNTGTWTTTNGTNYLGAGADTVTIGNGGVWNAVGSTTHFDLFVEDDDDDAGDAGDAGGAGFLALPLTGDKLIIAAGGTLNAGNTVFTGLETLELNGGTLSTVNGVVGQSVKTDGDVVINAGSVLHVETGANGVNDVLLADGLVDINGGTLRVTHVGSAPATIGNVHTIIQAGDVDGKFTNSTVANTAFLGWNIAYTDTKVNLTYAQLRAFKDAGLTPNQVATATGADSLPVTNPLFLAIANLPNDAAARAAFEGLSGEIHPGARTAMMEDSRLPRNAVLERLQTPTDGAIWGQGFWNSGSSDGAKSGNTATIDRETWGALLGVDFPLGENGVFGVAGSYLSNDLEQLDRRAEGSVDSWHALGYIGTQAGNLNLKAGVGYAWGSIDTTRAITVGSVNNTLIADYDSTLLQAFAEAGVRLPLSGGYVEPMVNAIYLKAKSDAFTESGGPAALEAKKASDSNTLITVGSRFSTASIGAFSVRGMVGWQHVFGSRIPYTDFNFAGGSTFSIAGVSQSKDAAVANIEANFALGENSALGIGYDGVVGNDSQDHAAKVTLRFAF